MMRMMVTLLFQICVSGVCGVPGQLVLTRAVVESGSATGGHWPPLWDLDVGANRPKARAATRDSALVHLAFIYHFNIF